ncbi:MAG: hypothetical protein Q9161_009412 [Pseudevernia consocians]
MDNTQRWAHFEESIENPTMTEDDKKQQQERKTHQREIMLGRAEIALGGNQRLLEKRQMERKFSNKDWHATLRHQKNSLQGFKLARSSSRDDASSRETNL